MSKFVFNSIKDDGSVISVSFNADCWLDTFPHYLNMLRGAGFQVSNETSLLVDGIADSVIGDRDYIIKEPTNSKYYYDTSRNK